MEYHIKPSRTIKTEAGEIQSFLSPSEANLDDDTVKSFGAEWERFPEFTEQEIEKIGEDYFDIVNDSILTKNSHVLDVGCGSGRWSKFVAPKVLSVEAIDPSTSVITAANFLGEEKNVRVSQASVDNIPFSDNSFDLVFSLGVLHHIPDTEKGIIRCVDKVRNGGWFHIYLYYNLENRGSLYRYIYYISSTLRRRISGYGDSKKFMIADLIATLVYYPLARLSKILRTIGLHKISSKLPLAYYSDKSFTIMRNDALDRFGTPLEKRFSKDEISTMLRNAGLVNIEFSDKQPFWHAIGQKK